MSDTSKDTEVFKKLKKIVHDLRDPIKGCPWDKVQTHQSLKSYMIEEAYEAVDAIESLESDLSAFDQLKDELGDVLYQIYIHAELAEEKSKFRVEDVAQALIDKLIRRHPHVFGEVKVSGVEDVLSNWDAIKKTEKNEKPVSALDGITKALPALMKAQKLGEKSKQVGFDWDSSADILLKVQEELQEFNEAKNIEHQEEELGDLMFVIAQWARKKKFNLELCLENANKKFERRFKAMEKIATKPLVNSSMLELEELWKKVKLEERK